jgi:sugar lactone lactonase YvrE
VLFPDPIVPKLNLSVAMSSEDATGRRLREDAPMTALSTLIDGIDFGEGPRWHEGRLWYSDFYQHTVYAVDAEGTREPIVEVAGQPSGLGWLPDGTLLVVSMVDRKLMRFDGTTLSEHADLSGVAGFHCNDMVVDGRGNAYVGNFGFDLFTQGLEGAAPAKLALVRPDGSVEVAADELMFPNGSVITPDGSTLIVGETLGARYTAFDIAADATLSSPRTWASLEGYAPDGCTLDAAGGIWFADAVGARVVRVLEGGHITDTIDVGTGTFACMLGGDDGRTLFVLTAPGADPTQAAGAAAGAVLITRVEHPRAGRP